MPQNCPDFDTISTPKKSTSKKEAQRLFLETYAEHANVMLAAKAAGVHRTTVYKWLEHDEAFSLAYNQAKEDARDVVRAEIKRRGVDGWDENVYQNGVFAGKVHKYSDVLLIFHAKALMPEYRDKQQIEHSGSIDINGAKEQLLEKLSRINAENSEAS